MTYREGVREEVGRTKTVSWQKVQELRMHG